MPFDLDKAKDAVKELEDFTFASGQITVNQIQTAMLGGATLKSALDEIERLQEQLSWASGVVDKHAARIQELEGWLVEERANLIEAGGEPVRPKLCPEDQKDLDDLARDQLRAEGKISGEPAWKATKEREAAILDGMMAISRLRQIGEEEWGENGEATVLRAMLAGGKRDA